MENIVRTIYGAAVQTAQYMPIPLAIAPNTTLNEKLSINQNERLMLNEKPHMGYIAIGNGGHKSETGANGIGINKPVQHRSNDAALYNQLPFILREINNDIDSATRANYALRKQVTIDGTDYFAYYLKRINFTGVLIDTQYKTEVNGLTVSSEYTPNAGVLNPTPPEFNNTGVNTTSGDYLTASAKVPFIMSADDVAEFVNACNIIYKDVNYAIISELALCSGVDRNLTGDFGGVTMSYNEVVACQVCNFVSTMFIMAYNNNGINYILDIGATEPLFNITTA